MGINNIFDFVFLTYIVSGIITLFLNVTYCLVLRGKKENEGMGAYLLKLLVSSLIMPLFGVIGLCFLVVVMYANIEDRFVKKNDMV